MDITVNVLIEQPKEKVWSVITDIENCDQVISGIVDVQVHETPKEGLIGLKWSETRLMFGKQASETMWITEAVENQYYCTRAESHGSVYITKLALTDAQEHCQLTMSFKAEPQSFFVKIMSALMSVFFKKSMVKLLQQDLDDIKAYVEKNETE